LLTLIATATNAANLEPKVDAGEIGAVVSQLSLPNTLVQDLASGFENRFLVRVELLTKGNAVARTVALITVKYDLWDETFFVTRQIAAGPVDKVDVQNAEEMLGYLNTMTFNGLFKAATLPNEQDLVMQVELLANPIEREKIERLRQWVAANSAPRSVVDRAAFTPKPNDLFNRIFEQYTRGADVAAPWRVDLMSQPFRLHKLPTESGAK
jgi:hypothetical protein